MKISKLLKFLLTPFMMYAGEEGGGGAVDRGDFLPDEGGKDEPDDKAKADAQAEIDKIAAEKDDKKDDKNGGDKADKKDDDKADDKKKDEEDAEDDDTEEGKEKDKKAKKDNRIPLSRHKEMLEKERERTRTLEAQLAQVQKTQKVAAVNTDIAAAETALEKMEGEYTKLMADGETEKAAAKMKEIRQTEREINTTKSTMEIAAAEARAVERVRYDVVVDRLEAAYPQLVDGHEDYDQDAVNDVLDMKAMYEGRGLAPSAALQKAVGKVLGAATKKQETATEATPEVDKEAKAAALKAERKEAAVKAGLDAAGKTPPTAAKVGIDSDKIGGGISAKNAMALSQKEFAKLDQKTLAQLRGDEL